MNCYCDYDQPEFYHRETPTACKEHKCHECGSPIKSGEKYERVSAKWDSEVGTVKTCMDCVAIRSALMEMDCFCWAHGGLWEDIHMQFQEAYFPPGMRYSCLRLVAGHRAHKRRSA